MIVDILGFKFFTPDEPGANIPLNGIVQTWGAIDVDVMRTVRAGGRLTSRTQTRTMLAAYKQDRMTIEEVVGAIEVMVAGAVADTRAFHRIPPPAVLPST